MTDDDIEALYKSVVDVSHKAALCAVFSAGFAEGSGMTIGTGAVDLVSQGTALTPEQVDDLTESELNG